MHEYDFLPGQRISPSWRAHRTFNVPDEFCLAVSKVLEFVQQGDDRRVIIDDLVPPVVLPILLFLNAVHLTEVRVDRIAYDRTTSLELHGIPRSQAYVDAIDLRRDHDAQMYAQVYNDELAKARPTNQMMIPA